jgi:hypothetical protein
MPNRGSEPQIGAYEEAKAQTVLCSPGLRAVRPQLKPRAFGAYRAAIEERRKDVPPANQGYQDIPTDIRENSRRTGRGRARPQCNYKSATQGVNAGAKMHRLAGAKIHQ